MSQESESLDHLRQTQETTNKLLTAILHELQRLNWSNSAATFTPDLD
jgi:hypothetical protein